MKQFVEAIGTTTAIACLLFAAAEAWAFTNVYALAHPPPARAVFLNVGQGDSELMMLRGGVKIMTDAGPDGSVLDSLAKIMPPGDTYIDIAIISHPQLDHFGGYRDVLAHYDVGVFIYNGRDDDPGVSAWPALVQAIRERHIPLLTLGKGDSIRYEGNEMNFLGPDHDFASSAELNDTGFIELVTMDDLRVLLTADTGFNVEDALLGEKTDVHADVLKVGHHGSRYSSGNRFLRAVDPSAAIIEVGARNTYGHPGRETLARIASSTHAHVFRTDQDGTVILWKDGGKLKAQRTGP